MADDITIKAGDTEPLPLTIAATGLTDLTLLTSATLYARRSGSSTNHVTAGALTVPDTGELTLMFDPLGAKVGGGNAFDAPGVYKCYVKAVWNDADITRHPGEGHITVTATEAYE